MKTIRLLYPDHVSGGLETYYLGAKMMAQILPENPDQPLCVVDIDEPAGKHYPIHDGIYGKEQVTSGILNATKILEKERPDKIITIGGNCIVSLAPFDYLHGLYKNIGILWIDAHPDVSTSQNGYPNAHAMVLGALLGKGEKTLCDLMKNDPFDSHQIQYIGLQGLHDYQEDFLQQLSVNYKIQTDEFLSLDEIHSFINQFDHILIHLDIDVLDPVFFHSTYFANPELIGDGSGGGKMTLDKLAEILAFINDHTDIIGLTVAEYLPFEEHKLQKIFNKIHIFQE